ncbi:MAG: efflux RND transporter periplasmic adaptor subunit [Desulfobacteraceae bacterium]|nr:efflux RND transporter periplasmic adaptor subunit [Desulfobacteraceae bacterium]
MKKIFSTLLVIIGCFALFACESDTIDPGQSKAGSTPTLSFETLLQPEKVEITQMVEAVGTIRPKTESKIESQVTAQVERVLCRPGTRVKKDQVLIELDARTLLAKLKQANEGLEFTKNSLQQAQKSQEEAKAGLDQTHSTYLRSKKLVESRIVSSHQYEIDKATYLKAKARLEKSKQAKLAAGSSIRQAEHIVKEAGIALGFSRIKAPAEGIVARRMIDPGDLAVPGKPLLIIQTSGALRLEASVRESLISRIVQGKKYGVRIETAGILVTSKIEEIVPYADPDTRTFLVKAAIPDTPGIYPGMFGRLLIPVKKKAVLLIPKEAVTRVGQLELVHVQNKESWSKVFIKTGKEYDQRLEVLSGLDGNETIGF